MAVSLLAAALAVTAAGGLLAQGPATTRGSTSRTARAPDPVAQATRAEPQAPHLDGRLDEPAWQAAPRFSGFVQRDPDEGQPATEPTEFRVVYTDDALFVGVRATDSRAGEIAALLTRRDEWSPSDEVTVMIDSYRDRRTGFAFTVNAAGVKRDAYLYNDYDRDERWDAVWDVAVSVDESGWTAEFRIPFSQLRFAAGPSTTFGFNVSRRLNRLNETQYWRLVPKQSSGFVSQFGDLTNLDGLRTPRRVELLPYSAASSELRPAQTGNPFRTGSAQRATLGGDVKLGITPALTLTATFNPDFGQVEADPAVVNLSAFESFFAERRPFFTEGLDIFRFRIADGDGDGSEEELFYTRRIGRAPQGAADPRGGFAEPVSRTTILGAAKLSGKTQSGWTIGMLGALTAQENARVLAGDGASFVDPVEPRTGYGVARVARELRGGQTVIGFFGTTVQRSLPDRLSYLHSAAYTAGFNLSHRFANNTYQISARAVGSRVEGSTEALLATQRSSARYFQRPDAGYVEVDSSRTSLEGYTFALNGGRTAGNWRWNVGMDARSPGFEANDIGFMRETDRIQQSVWINRRWLTPGTVFRRFNVNFNQWSGWTFGGERRWLGGNVNANYTLLSYWSGWFGLNRNWGGLSPTALRGGPAIRTPGSVSGWFGMQSDERKAVRGSGNLSFNARDDGAGYSISASTSVTWRPAPNLDLSAGPGLSYNRDQWQYLATSEVANGPAYLFGELRQRTTSMTVRSNVTFSPTLSLQVYAQPFVSSGNYVGFKRVVAPRADRFADRFDRFDGERVSRTAAGDVAIDVEGDGQTDVTLGNPDFTVLSFRSNVVLRWEYKLGSTLFLVWQHGRNGFERDGEFGFGRRVGDIFRSPGENVLLVKLNYWLSL